MIVHQPVHVPVTRGQQFDFGTHANDFLVSREHTGATECFTVRVPGRGAVPEHEHVDMEQTFMFLSGTGTAILHRDGQRHEYRCRPGDMVFVPTGWRHSVQADSIDGVTYLTVNAFVSGIDRIGDTALAHAQHVNDDFAARRYTIDLDGCDATSIFRTAETIFQHDGTRAWPRDYTALTATLTSNPETYRVTRVGPFEIAHNVEPAERILSTDLADRIAATVAGMAVVMVEGSQSPLSVKPPCTTSDLDLLVVVRTRDEMTMAAKTIDALHALAGQVPVPVATGIVHADWLRLPAFYSAISIDPQSTDRRWWSATPAECRSEAAQRVAAGVDALNDAHLMTTMLNRTLAVVDRDPRAVQEWQVTPRWIGLQVRRS